MGTLCYGHSIAIGLLDIVATVRLATLLGCDWCFISATTGKI